MEASITPWRLARAEQHKKIEEYDNLRKLSMSPATLEAEATMAGRIKNTADVERQRRLDLPAEARDAEDAEHRAKYLSDAEKDELVRPARTEWILRCVVLDAIKMWIVSHGNRSPKCLHLTQDMEEALNYDRATNGIRETLREAGKQWGFDLIFNAPDFLITE
jgi:hypothetical protein